MGKTKVLVHVDGNPIEIETDLSFDSTVIVLLSRIPIAGLGEMYSVDNILCIDITENTIEIEGTVI